MDLAPAAEGKPLVRNRAEEIVPEPQLVRPLPGHELPESAPAVEIADVLELVRQHVGEEVELEAGPEDRGIAKEKSIAGLERVDPRRDQRLDRLWKRRDATLGSGGRDELAYEERVAARALRDLAQQFLGQGDLSSGREREPSSLLAGERRELEDPLPVAGLVDEGQALRPARDRHEPGPRRAAAHEMQEDAVRGVVDPVCVLEDDERGHHQHAEQELLDRLEDALATERRLDLLGFRRHRHFGVEGDREQREPGRELGHDGLDPGLEAIAGLGGALRIGDSGERAEQGAKRQVRGRTSRTGRSARRAA